MAATKKSQCSKDALAKTVSMAAQNPLFRGGAYLLFSGVVIWLLQQDRKMGSVHHEHNELKEHNHHNDDEEYNKVIKAGIIIDRCHDPGYPVEWKDIPIKKICQCPDPLLPNKREGVDHWDAHHQVLVESAADAATEELDVVLLGDSITEHWYGTGDMGTVARSKERVNFEQFFDKKSGAPLQGLALGTSADASTNLLWHLQNGMLPDQLQPKVWLLLIGTNDLGRLDCSKRTALAGILQVARYLHGKRPGTPLLVHGLLPRNDVGADEDHPEDLTRNRCWQDILWINRRLEKFCSLHSDCYYVEADDLFLTRVESDADHPDGADAQGAVMINQTLMPDALHPNVAGYDVWGPRIVEEVLKLIPK
jgi:lysophospholipase L1-like esterase